MDIAGFLEVLDRLAPESLAEEWDNVGLIVGRRAHVVRRVLVALDLRTQVLDEASEAGADTILVHHPPIFPSLTAVADLPGAPELVLSAAERRIAVVAAHTNLDSAVGGLNDQMAELLALSATAPLAPSDPGSAAGLGRVGTSVDPRLSDVVARLGAALGGPVTWVGDPDAPVARVACCTGSGAAFIDAAHAAGAAAYVTSDLKYHDADRAPGMALVCIPHGQIEALALARWLPQLAGQLDGSGASVASAATVTDPWRAVGPSAL